MADGGEVDDHQQSRILGRQGDASSESSQDPFRISDLGWEPLELLGPLGHPILDLVWEGQPLDL